MKKIISLAFFAFLCILTIQAQTEKFNLNGSVLNSETNEALIGATIFVKETNTATTTDRNGNYSVNITKLDSYTVEYSYVGYETKVIVVDATDGKISASIVSYLKPSIVQLDKFNINASRVDDNSPITYSTNEQLLIDIKSKNNIKDINSYTDYLNSKVNFNNICLLTVKQLDEYFDKKRTIFDIPIYQKGTDFQNKVWNEVAKIPYGQTCSYKDIAIKIGKPTAYRAVGNANNKNNIPIIIPCHRVIGSNKKLVGYAGGLNIKKSLLGLEKNNKQQNY
jgi:methylated-DNA-[protein]-cysteine S-methyltransferase